MDRQEYSVLAMRTKPDFDMNELKVNAQMGLMGEAGEVVDALKKWRFQSGDNYPLPKEKIIGEIGDVYWYSALYCHTMGIGLDGLPSGVQRQFDLTPSLCDFLCDTALVAGRIAAELTSNQDQMNARYRLKFMLELYGMMLEKIGSSEEEAMQRNIDKLKKRYPDGFDPERSIHREN